MDGMPVKTVVKRVRRGSHGVVCYPGSRRRRGMRTGVRLARIAMSGRALTRILERRLVFRRHWIDGYSDFRLIRASSVLNRQSTDAFSGLRFACQAPVSRQSCSRSGIRRPRHCRVMTPSARSASPSRHAPAPTQLRPAMVDRSSQRTSGSLVVCLLRHTISGQQCKPRPQETKAREHAKSTATRH